MKNLIVVSLLLVAMITAVSMPAALAYHGYARHDRPLLEARGEEVLRAVLGPDYTVEAVGSEVYDGPSDKNLTFVYLVAESGEARLFYDIVFWNDEPAFIVLVQSCGTLPGSTAVSAGELVGKYVRAVGRETHLRQYDLIRRERVSGSEHTVELQVVLETPVNPIYYTLLLVTVENGLPVKIVDNTYVRLPLPVDTELLPPEKVVEIAREEVPRILDEIQLECIIDSWKVSYHLALVDQKSFTYGVIAQVDFYFEEVQPGGVYGIRITVDASTGMIRSWSTMGAFGLKPLTNPVAASGEASQPSHEPVDAEITLSPEAAEKTSKITLSYHYDEEKPPAQLGIKADKEEIIPLDPGIYALSALLPIMVLFVKRIGKKRSTYVIMLLLVLIIPCLSTYPSHVEASTSSILGSRYGVPSDEQYYDSQAASAIAKYSKWAVVCWYVAGTPYCVPRFDSVKNLYGSSTTASNIYDAAEGFGEDSSIVFYIGEGGIATLDDPQGSLDFWFITTDDGKQILDYCIHQYSSSQPNELVFLWSCRQGDVIGGYYLDGLLPYGMPHAWLHTTQLSSDGYNNPDSSGLVFIGFDGPAPYLKLEIGGVETAGYKFVTSFYNVLLLKGFRVKDALDCATWMTWGISSWNNIPITTMVVYGDSTIRITWPALPEIE